MQRKTLQILGTENREETNINTRKTLFNKLKEKNFHFINKVVSINSQEACKIPQRNFLQHIIIKNNAQKRKDMKN